MVKVYHGSPYYFTEFDYSRMGQIGTSEGFGFYFTDNPQIALGYAFTQGNKGYLYTADFFGRKGLSPTRITLTVTDLKQFLTRIHRIGQYLDNYGDSNFEGFHNVLNRATKSLREYCDNDVDLIGSIINSYGSAEQVLRVLYHMFGYDHIKTRPEWVGESYIYVMLVPEAFRISGIKEVYRP